MRQDEMSTGVLAIIPADHYEGIRGAAEANSFSICHEREFKRGQVLVKREGYRFSIVLVDVDVAGVPPSKVQDQEVELLVERSAPLCFRTWCLIRILNLVLSVSKSVSSKERLTTTLVALKMEMLSMPNPEGSFTGLKSVASRVPISLNSSSLRFISTLWLSRVSSESTGSDVIVASGTSTRG